MKEKDISKENSQAVMTRREFVGAVGAGIGAICILGAPGIVAAAKESDTRIRSILYDSTKCIGCHTCEKACKIVNNLPGSVGTVNNTTGTTVETTSTTTSQTTTDTIVVAESTPAPTVTVGGGLDADTWLKVTVEEKTLSGEGQGYLCARLACMHCGSCAQVCPSKALVQREDGIVTMDPAKCIGCRYCYGACPFDIPRYSEDGSMRKCIMCYGLVDEGKKPACVEACPTNALTFRYRDELVRDGKERVSELVEEGYSDAYLYGEKELGGTPLMYVLPHSYGLYGLPKLPLEAQKPVTWKDFTIPVGIVAGLAALAFGGITYIKNRGEKVVKEGTSKDK